MTDYRYALKTGVEGYWDILGVKEMSRIKWVIQPVLQISQLPPKLEKCETIQRLPTRSAHFATCYNEGIVAVSGFSFRQEMLRGPVTDLTLTLQQFSKNEGGVMISP